MVSLPVHIFKCTFGSTSFFCYWAVTSATNHVHARWHLIGIFAIVIGITNVLAVGNRQQVKYFRSGGFLAFQAPLVVERTFVSVNVDPVCSDEHVTGSVSTNGNVVSVGFVGVGSSTIVLRRSLLWSDKHMNKIKLECAAIIVQFIITAYLIANRVGSDYGFCWLLWRCSDSERKSIIVS